MTAQDRRPHWLKEASAIRAWLERNDGQHDCPFCGGSGHADDTISIKRLFNAARASMDIAAAIRALPESET